MALVQRPVYGLTRNGVPVISPTTGQQWMRKAPFGWVHRGFKPSEVVMFSPGWEDYTGLVSALSQECGVVVPVDGAPVWTLASLPSATEGQYYSQTFSLASVGTAAAGHTLTGVYESSLPAWLSLVNIPSDNAFALRGTVPAGITTFDVTLILAQSVSGATAKTFTVPVDAVSVRAYGIYYSGNKTLVVYIGGDGSGNPMAQMLYSPPSFTDHATYSVGRSPSTVTLGTSAYYFGMVWEGVISGDYTPKINWLGRVRYVTLTIDQNQDWEGPLTLTDVAPTPPPATTTPWVYAPVVTTGITLVKRRFGTDGVHYYVRGTPFDSNAYYVQQRHNPQSPGVAGWSTWQDNIQFLLTPEAPNTSLTGDWHANLGASGTATQVEFRVVGSSGTVVSAQAVLHYDFTFPSSPTSTETLLQLS